MDNDNEQRPEAEPDQHDEMRCEITPTKLHSVLAGGEQRSAMGRDGQEIRSLQRSSRSGGMRHDPRAENAEPRTRIDRQTDGRTLAGGTD